MGDDILESEMSEHVKADGKIEVMQDKVCDVFFDSLHEGSELVSQDTFDNMDMELKQVQTSVQTLGRCQIVLAVIIYLNSNFS